MKKITMIAAVLAVCTFSACAEEVLSDNIVGYSKIALTAGKSVLTGTQFASIGFSDANFNDTLTGDIPYGTEIMVYDSSTPGYVNYYYVSDALDPITWEDRIGWASDGMYVTDAVDLGLGFWVGGTDDGIFIQAGEVLADENVVITIEANKYDMICSPFPCAINLNDTKSIVWGENLPYGTEIMIYDISTSNYVNYYYVSDALDPITWEDRIGWASDGMYLTDAVLLTGSAFWIKTTQETTVTFKNPTKTTVE